jgi:hypothetical protein
VFRDRVVCRPRRAGYGCLADEEAFDAEVHHDRVWMPQVDVDGLTINYEVQGRASRFC